MLYSIDQHNPLGQILKQRDAHQNLKIANHLKNIDSAKASHHPFSLGNIKPHDSTSKVLMTHYV